jgi:lipopolysaccharide assembly protein A
MARNRSNAEPEELSLDRTRASSVWVAVGVLVVFLILLIIFIAQNNRKVPIHFFTFSGQSSLALALLVAAVGGAIVVLLAGAARVIQLRVSTHRHNRRVRKAAKAAPEPTAEPGSTPAATESEAQPVEPQNHP